MMRALLLLALASCDRLFLDENQPLAPDAAPDAPVSRVTGTIMRRVVTNSATGVPMSVDVPASGASLLVRFPDTQARVPIDANGTFVFERASDDTRYALVVSVDGRVIEVQHVTPTLQLLVAQLGPPNSARVPVTKPTLVLLPLFTSGTIVTTGLWTTTLGIYAVLYDYVDWLQSQPLFGRRGLLSAARNDVLYYLGYGQRAGAPYTEVTGFIEKSTIEMTDGATIDLRGEPVTLTTRNGCTRLTAPGHGEEEERFVGATPGYPTRGADWAITATPDLSIGPLGETRIAAISGATATPIDLDVGFTNPIRGSKLLASVGYGAARPLTYPGATATQLGAALRHYYPVELSLDCAANARALASTGVGIPGEATLAGVRLAGDSVVVPIDPGTDPELVWELAAEGAVDRYEIALLEVLEDAVSGITTTRAIRTIITAEPRVTIDGGLLISGAYYVFVIVSKRGYPGAASGDISTITYPLSTAVTNSSMFQVQ